MVSDFVRTELLRRYPDLAPKLVRVPGAVRSNLRELAAQRSGIDGSRQTGPTFELLSVARIHPRKGLDLAINALARLPDELKKTDSLPHRGAPKTKGLCPVPTTSR